MTKVKGYGAPLRLLCAVVLAATLAACTGGATGYQSSAASGPDGSSSASGGQGTVDAGGGPFGTLADDPGLLQDLPAVLELETLADTGLQVAYTAAGQRAAIDPLFVQAQWQHMQQCLSVNAPAPYVIIIDGSVAPFVATDDVIRDITGANLATASVTGDGTVVQITAADFDGSIGDPGFSLRSIMGRALWLGASLAERDYPFRCALSVPVSSAG